MELIDDFNEENIIERKYYVISKFCIELLGRIDKWKNVKYSESYWNLWRYSKGRLLSCKCYDKTSSTIFKKWLE